MFSFLQGKKYLVKSVKIILKRMRTIRNILLGLAALTISLSTIEAQNNKLHKKQKSDESWISVGPGNFSGRVLAVHVDNKNPQKIYAGAAGGGLWISTNDGVSWNRCPYFPGSAAVSAIAQDAAGTIYIGTGEAYGLSDPGVKTNISNYGIKGDGIYTTRDDVEFDIIPGTEDLTVVSKLVYSSKDNIMYAATNDGLKAYFLDEEDFRHIHDNTYKMVTDLSVGLDGTILYSNVDLESYTRTADVMLKIPDGSFTSLSSKLSSIVGRISVAIAPSDPDIMYIYATKTNGHFEGVYKTEDKGTAWRKIYKAPTYEGPSGNPNKQSEGGGYSCNVIAVSPNIASNVFAGTTYLYGGNVLENDTLDGGTILVKDTIYSFFPVISGEIYSISYTHNGFFVGTGTGLYRSKNDGVSFSRLNRYLTNLQVYSFSVSSEGQILLSARDNGSIYIEKPINSASQGTLLDYTYRSGINSATSMLKSEALYYADLSGSIFAQASINSDVRRPSQWYGMFRQLRDSAASTSASTKEFPRWYRSSTAALDQSALSNSSSYHVNVSPIIFWESINDLKSIDTIEYVADKSYASGDTITVRSNANGYPITIINNAPDTLYKDSAIYVQDIITSRFFLGGGSYQILRSSAPKPLTFVGAPVFMTTNALDLNIVQEDNWRCVFRTRDTTEQVIELQISKDGDHLFILTKKQSPTITTSYSLYRVSGFDTYRKQSEIEVEASLFSTSASVGADNPDRKLINDTLIYEKSVSAIGGIGAILSICLDPQNDDNLLYTTNDLGSVTTPRINLITNATTATLSTVTDAIKVKEGTGLPDESPVYTAIIEMANSNIAFVGTDKGVYKTESFENANPVWVPYNEGINANIPVFKLFQQTKQIYDATCMYYNRLGEAIKVFFPGVHNTGIIYAGTHGLGMFTYSEYFQPHPTSISPIKPIANNSALKVYPNPASNVVTVDFTLAKDEQVQLNIVDITGKVIFSNNIGNRDTGLHSEMIDCSKLSSGLYFVNMKTNTQNKTAKIIITK